MFLSCLGLETGTCTGTREKPICPGVAALCRAEEKPDIHGGSRPQHNLPVGQCPTATTEREQGSVESI